MSKKNYTEINFEGKDFFIGTDVSKKNRVITIRCNDMELKRESIDPCPKVLETYLRRRYAGGAYHTVYEAGYAGFRIHRKLTEMGIDSMVANAADVPTSAKEKDRRDEKTGCDSAGGGKASQANKNHMAARSGI